MGAGVPLDGTSSIIVAIVLMTYVFMSMLTEQFFHRLHHYIKHHLHDSKEAYLNVLEKVKDEIMLVGVLTVVLLVVEERVAEDICITLICSGIPNTKPSCDLVADPDKGSSYNSSSSSSSSSRRMLLGAGSGPAPTCKRYDGCCSRGNGFESSKCGDGQQNFASIKALHHIHYLILFIMLTHIFMTIAVMYGADKKVKSWGKFEEEHENETALKPREETGFVHFLCSCQKQFHESVTPFTYVAIKNYFIARNKEKVEAEEKATGKKFNFFNELKKDVEHEYTELTGVSAWMWVVMSLQTIVKGEFYDTSWGTYASIILIMMVGSKLDRIKAKIGSQIFKIADADGNGEMDNAEFAELSKVDGEILEKLRQVEPDFWRRNPNIVLVMIRLVIWLNSSEIGTSLFYFMTYTDDGLDKNCYYLRRGWFLIIFNTVLTILVAVHCSVNVIPLYALTSNLGSHQVPRPVNMAIFVPEKLATKMAGGAKKSSKISPASETTKDH